MAAKTKSQLIEEILNMPSLQEGKLLGEIKGVREYFEGYSKKMLEIELNMLKVEQDKIARGVF